MELTYRNIAIAVVVVVLVIVGWAAFSRADGIQPSIGDCDHPINEPIAGQLPSTVTWCPDSQDNPVLQPKL